MWLLEKITAGLLAATLAFFAFILPADSVPDRWWRAPCIGCSEQTRFQLGIEGHSIESGEAIRLRETRSLFNLKAVLDYREAQGWSKALAQLQGFPPGTFQNRAAIDGGVAATYKGPGDVVSSASAWGSCARVYNAALASTSTSLCDLVSSSAPTVTICTLRGSSTGFVDLSAYCTGGTQTPAALCALQTGGVCNVQKVYDQTGNTTGWVQVTAASQPKITFSAINGLPGWTCTAAANSSLITSTTFGSGGTVAITSPYTWVSVAERTANTGVLQALMGWTTNPNGYLGFNNAAATAIVTSDGANKVTLGSVADSAFHAMIGVINSSTTGVLGVDGTETTGTTNTQVPANVTARICRFAGGNSLDGIMMEAGLWGSAISSGNRTSLNSNMHGINGYNF